MITIVEGGLTKKQYGILRAANRSCGLSYRSACNRGIDQVLELKNHGLLRMVDTKRSRGQYKFYTTEAAKGIL